MAKSICVLWMVALAGTQQIGFAAGARTLRMRWADVGNMITERRVVVQTADGAAHKGRILSVSAEALRFEDPKAQLIRREEVVGIRLTDYVGNGRRRGKLLGGAAGLMFGLAGAAVIGMKEGSANSARDKALAITLGVGGFPAGLLLGYLAGRQFDKEVTVIYIIPEAE